ncbi:hypothetical protein [Streptomyces cacaoi]|uniref:hypothetical protein n=1 Tax=Streptomyces cacaoi TaxID=1898 RepID=UPI00260F37DF|nr:hypothetical protein [Streptomyces cacaoi]
MALTVSAAVLFGALTVFLLRGRYTGIGAALVLFLFGFFTAGTGAASVINDVCRALTQAIGRITA